MTSRATLTPENFHSKFSNCSLWNGLTSTFNGWFKLCILAGRKVVHQSSTTHHFFTQASKCHSILHTSFPRRLLFKD